MIKIRYGIVMPRLTEINDQSYQFPIGMAYVSSSLKNSGRDVVTYTLNYKEGEVKELIEKWVREKNIDVLATGGLTAHYRKLKEILDAARAVKPDIILAVGGGIITSSPIPAMEALEIADYGMIGEGEVTICELAETLEGKRDAHTVDGLIFKKNGSWTITQSRAEIMDLDSLPYPDYEGFDFDELLNKTPTDVFALGQSRFGFLSLGRSCPFNCTFCFHPSGTRYRRRSMESAFREIDYLIEHFDIQNVYITDELFATKLEDVKVFCAEIKKRKLGFIISLRVDLVNREILELLRDHGCMQVCFGLESADNRILKSMNKHITVEQIDYALSLCNELGIRSQGNFIFGDEAETVETANNTIKWWKEHPQYTISTILIVLYPGSVLYQNACKRGIIKDEVQFIKDGCPLTNVSRMTDEEYRDMALTISMLTQGRTAVLKDASTQYIGFGKVDYTARCSKCGEFNTWKSLDPYRTISSLICEHCGHSMHIVVADSVTHHADQYFRLFKQHKVGIWPMASGVVEELRRAAPSIMDKNVWFIDSAKIKQGAHFHSKIVESPDVIAREGIDTVFITGTNLWAAEIAESLKQFPSVKNVFFAGDLFDPDFPQRVNFNISSSEDNAV